MIAEHSGSKSGSPPAGLASIFVCDASADTPSLVSTLGGAGYEVFHVPLSLIVNRVEVQKPAVIYMDVDAVGALGAAQQIRDIPGTRTIHVLYSGKLGTTLSGDDDARFYEGSAFFARPVDSRAVLEKVEQLVGLPLARQSQSSSLRPLRGNASGSRPASVPPSSREAAGDIPSATSLPPISAPSDSAFESVAASASEAPLLSLAPMPALGGGNEAATGWSEPAPHSEMSPHLKELLSEAEERVSVAPAFALPAPQRPSPEQELDAILPEEILHSLDEPLDFDDDLSESEAPPWGTRVHTEEGRVPTGTSAPRPERSTSVGTKTGLKSEVTPESEAPQRAEGSGGHASSGDTSGSSVLGTDAPTPPPLARPSRTLAREPADLPPMAPAHPDDEAVTTPPRPRHAAPTPKPPTPSRAPPRVPPRSPPPLEASPESATGTRSPSRPATNMRELSTRRPLADVGPASSLGRSEHPASHAKPSLSGGSLVPTHVARTHPGDASPPSADRFVGGPSSTRAALDSAPASVNPRFNTPPIPASLGQGDALSALAAAVKSRFTGALALEDQQGIRRVVLREGDFVTVASAVEDESLVAFLIKRGDMAAPLLKLARKLPPFGRHAGAALIAQGHLRQEDLWPVLRGHAEWLLSRCVSIERGGASLERQLPVRLESEPDVFGGSTGAEVLIEITRRVVAPEMALQRLSGSEARLLLGEGAALLSECALDATERSAIEQAPGTTVGETVTRAGSPDFAAVVYALRELGVIANSRGRGEAPSQERPHAAAADALDDDAIEARVARRRALVDNGDYFSLLGVTPQATGYEIRRAYVALRREFDPSVVLTARLTHLRDDVELIVEVLEEAYEILRDDARRERYRRALAASPTAPS